MTRILIMGPPGSGKGTQASRISGRLGVETISTGDIFRENVLRQTPLGREAQRYLDSGDFVPDKITNDMVRDRLGAPDVGYPRTLAQTAFLDQILAEGDQKLDGVLHLAADADELVCRLLRRAEEAGRSDDKETVIRHRLELYNKETEPLLALYSRRSILTTIEGRGSVDEVTNRAIRALASTGTQL
ncbi:adenylate kinase [Paenarthrobacter nicotinovorans]|uniref:adenylate kinase n=1 Tax=Paenarthrobacter nicotinovorans TaxID=29320 RepID=UPI003D6709FD